MEHDLQVTIFYALAVAACLPGIFILFARDIVRVAFWLLCALSGVAGLYLLLGADFLGLTQVLVYIGGVMVLILFGIMMTNRDPALNRAVAASRRSVVTGLAIAGTLFALSTLAILRTPWAEVKTEPATGATVDRLGAELLTGHVLPFEIISVLLLMVLCGAAYIARRRGEESHA